MSNRRLTYPEKLLRASVVRKERKSFSRREEQDAEKETTIDMFEELGIPKLDVEKSRPDFCLSDILGCGQGVTCNCLHRKEN